MSSLGSAKWYFGVPRFGNRVAAALLPVSVVQRFRLRAQCLRPSSVFNVEVSALSEVRSGVLETLNRKP